MALPRTTVLALAGAVLIVGLSSVSAGGALTTDGQSTDREVFAQSSTNVSVENVTVWIAPESASGNLTDEAAIDAAKESGTLTRNPRVALTDTLVLEMNATTLEERVATVDGDNETDRFLRAVYGEDSHVTLVQTNAGPETQALAAQFDHASTTVVPTATTDRFYLVVEPEKLPVRYCGSACPWRDDDSPVVGNVSTERLPHAAFAMNVTVDGHTSSHRQEDDGDLAPVFDVSDVEVEVIGSRSSGRPVTLSADREVRVPLLTTLAPGTPVTVRIDNRSDGGARLTDSTTVTSDARNVDDPTHVHVATAEFETADVAPNATFDIEVVANGRVVENVTGVIDGPSAPTDEPSTATANTPSPPPMDEPESTTTTAEDTASTQGNDGTETTPDATEGTGPGFGSVAALVALLLAFAGLRWRTR